MNRILEAEASTYLEMQQKAQPAVVRLLIHCQPENRKSKLETTNEKHPHLQSPAPSWDLLLHSPPEIQVLLHSQPEIQVLPAADEALLVDGIQQLVPGTEQLVLKHLSQLAQGLMSEPGQVWTHCC